MSIAIVSLIVLVVIVLISCFVPRLNPGLLSLLATLIIGIYWGNYPLNTLLAGFPIQLFLLLVSMGLVFGTAQQNGTLQVITEKIISVIHGKTLLLPIVYFFIALFIAALGPGNIAAVAVLAPLMMSVSRRYGISPLLTAIMLCTGANAGAFSPFAPTGVVAIGLMDKIGITQNVIWIVFGASAVLQSLSATGAYILFLLRAKKRGFVSSNTTSLIQSSAKIEKKQTVTLLFIAMLMVGVIVFKIPLLLMAIGTAVFLFVFNLGEEDKVLASLPWGTIQMVTGIAVLIALLEKTGGLEIATSFIATVTKPNMIHGVMAFVTGVVSAYSSSSGVVMPAFIPLIPGLAEKMGIILITPLVIAVAVGSHMVDVSPLSTLGALSIAAIDSKSEQKRVFKLLLLWGMSMSIVGGILAFIFLDLTYKYIVR